MNNNNNSYTPTPSISTTESFKVMQDFRLETYSNLDLTKTASKIVREGTIIDIEFYDEQTDDIMEIYYDGKKQTDYGLITDPRVIFDCTTSI